MSKLPSVSGQQVVAALQSIGFRIRRQHGSDRSQRGGVCSLALKQANQTRQPRPGCRRDSEDGMSEGIHVRLGEFGAGDMKRTQCPKSRRSNQDRGFPRE